MPEPLKECTRYLKAASIPRFSPKESFSGPKLTWQPKLHQSQTSSSIAHTLTRSNTRRTCATTAITGKANRKWRTNASTSTGPTTPMASARTAIWLNITKRGRLRHSRSNQETSQEMEKTAANLEALKPEMTKKEPCELIPGEMVIRLPMTNTISPSTPTTPMVNTFSWRCPIIKSIMRPNRTRLITMALAVSDEKRRRYDSTKTR